jgi:hypothetical protein
VVGFEALAHTREVALQLTRATTLCSSARYWPVMCLVKQRAWEQDGT